MTVGANFYHLILNLLIGIIFPIKNVGLRYAQHKGFSCFDWTLTGELMTNQSGKLKQQKLSEIHIAGSDFNF